MKLLTLALILAVSGTVAVAGTPIDERLDAAPDAKIIIENLSGNVTVKGWEKDEVTITGTLADDAEELSIEGNEKRIEIEVLFPRGARNLRDTDSDIEVFVPHKSRVHVSAVNASIEATGVNGTVAVETVNGSITVAGEPRMVEAETVNGSIHITASASNVEAESVSGSIELHGVEGDVSANTVSGRIEVRGGEFDRLDCATVSGSIRFDGMPSEDGNLELECHSGSVTLLLPEDVSAEFEVETFSGSINNDFGPEARRTSQYAPGKELEFTNGSGDAMISVSSFSGTVNLKIK